MRLTTRHPTWWNVRGMRLLVVVLALLASAPDAAADTPRHALRWARAPGADSCIDQDGLSAAVEQRLGRRVFTRAEQPAVVIEAQVSPGWHVAIAVRGADGSSIGERVYDEPAPDCRALDEALVLVIALIIDPNAALAEPRPPSAPPPPREPWRFGVGASVLVGAGIMPGVSLGAALYVAIDAPVLPAIEVRGSAWSEDETRDQDQGGRFSALAGGVSVRVPLWKLDLGAGLELARMSGSGIGFDRVQEARALVPAITVDPRFSIRITDRARVVAGITLWIPLVRPRFTFEQGGQDLLVFQPSPVGGWLHAGAVLRF